MGNRVKVCADKDLHYVWYLEIRSNVQAESNTTGVQTWGAW